ncbi:MAG: hypothetical protein ABFQ82_04555, partial [Thermodesulfobacteriota bacterium]
MKILILLGLVAAFVLALIQGQHKMIYYPRPYPSGLKLPAGVIALEYTTGQGSQTAFYRPPLGGENGSVTSLWLVFGGNASLALGWTDFLADFPDRGAGFLLIDYPGYGRSRGRASPESILESTEKALAALVDRIKSKSSGLAENKV